MTGLLSMITVNGTDLEYELRGTAVGDPVVLIHWGVGATWAEPLLNQPALAGRHRLLSYHRAGFADSGLLPGQPAMAAHAAHCRQLMQELGITCPAPNRSNCPASPACCTGRTPPRWRTGWLASTIATSPETALALIELNQR